MEIKNDISGMGVEAVVEENEKVSVPEACSMSSQLFYFREAVALASDATWMYLLHCLRFTHTYGHLRAWCGAYMRCFYL